MGELAESGVTFTRYYAEDKCTPGRTTILTGRYVQVTEKLPLVRWP